MCILEIRHFQLPNLITEWSLILQLTGKLVTHNEVGWDNRKTRRYI